VVERDILYDILGCSNMIIVGMLGVIPVNGTEATGMESTRTLGGHKQCMSPKVQNPRRATFSLGV